MSSHKFERFVVKGSVCSCCTEKMDEICGECPSTETLCQPCHDTCKELLKEPEPKKGTVLKLGPTTWEGTLPLLLAILDSGTPKGKAETRKDLKNMAKVADAVPEMLTVLRSIYACVVFNDGPEIHLGPSEIGPLSKIIKKLEGWS